MCSRSSASQRAPRRGERVVRLEDGEAGAVGAHDRPSAVQRVGACTPISCARGDTGVTGNPVPRGLATAPPRRSARPGRGAADPHPAHAAAGAAPAEVDALRGGAAHAPRPGHGRGDAAGRAAPLRGARACGWPTSTPASGGCSSPRARAAGSGSCRSRPGSSPSLGDYLDAERPRTSATDRVFVVLKGPRRGEPLSAAGLDEILDGARGRAGLEPATCHQLRHTCFTRLREAGMALEAIQAQAGHASIESTRIYLHLANDWLAREYLRAAEAIEAQAAPVPRGGTRDERLTGAPRRRRRAGRRLPGRPGRGRDVRRAPGDLGGPHVLHPRRRRRAGPDCRWRSSARCRSRTAGLSVG